MDNKKQPDLDDDAVRLARVAELAHSFWEAEGRPEGRDLEHWLRAEAEVLGTPPAGTGDE